MKKRGSAQLNRAVRSYVRPGSVLWLAMVLCLIMTCAGLLIENGSSARSKHAEKTATPVLNPLDRANGADQAKLLVSRTLARPAASEDRVWREKENDSRVDVGLLPGPKFYRTLSLNGHAQRELLRRAPMEHTKAARQNQVVITLPMPDGTLNRFWVEESPVMAPKLAAAFPNIRTYRGRGVDDPTSTTRFDVTPSGFHAVVLSGQDTIIVEPDPHKRSGTYISYDLRNATKDASSFSCLVVGAEQASSSTQSKQLARKSNAANATSGATLRTYRLALAATAEFTQQFGGGTVAGTLSAMTTTINAVNAIFERDLAIHLKLIDNEPAIIFTNTATDGYTSDVATTLINQNQVVLDQRIGRANYDLGMVLDGHVFAYLPGKFIFQGAANYQSTCKDTEKGKAVTILRSTEPSTLTAIYVVAHELGHLLGALHTFNGTLDDCGPSRFAIMAYEPGGGSTIMGYSGGVLPDGTYYPLCATEDLNTTGTYFHTASIEQIFTYTSFANGSFCGVDTVTGNNPPVIDAGADFTIPANTPFTLTATGSDTNGDAITYCWEQFDLGAAGPPHTDNGNRPIFRSFAPVPTPARTFPQLSDILSGTTTFGESLPTTNRTLNFRVTARDNHPGGGGVNTGAMKVNVVADSGPFAVKQPGASTAWTAGSSQTVTWDVANTSSAPVNCANVRILLSTDGGNSFPISLASSVPNNGAATVNLPNTPTSSARVKVEAIGNIFFSISRPNFTISPNITLPPTLLTEVNTSRAIALDSISFIKDPFPLTNPYAFSMDQRTRIMLLATGLELMPGETLSVVTAQAEDASQRIFPLTVEYVGKVPGFNELTQVNIRLPDGLAGAGDVWVTLSVRGVASNRAIIRIQ